MSCMKATIDEQGICTYCQTADASNINDKRHLPVRTILKGKYLIGRVIGEGGFGITYIGYDLDLQFPVAIKEFCPREFAGREMTDRLTLLPFDAGSEEIFEQEKEKFIDEARRLARFRNEQGVVSVLDYFKENETAYIVMDFVEGITLRKYLGMLNTLMPLSELLTLLKPLMETLEKIHGEQMIHRDISPDNIMIRKDRKKVYLIDFGTARDVTAGHTLSVYRKGAYTPLEQQSRDGHQGSWTDVYALCATIYYCITGKTIPEAVDRVMEDKLIPPSKLGVEISSAMEEILLKGLAIRPENRVQTMGELMQVLYAMEKQVAKEEDTTVPIESTSKEQKDSSDIDTTVPLDQDGNVDMEALPVSDAVRYEAKRKWELLEKEGKRIFIFDNTTTLALALIMGMFYWCFYEKMMLIGVTYCVIYLILGVGILPNIISSLVADSIKKSKIKEEMFPNNFDKAILLLQIKALKTTKQFLKKDRFLCWIGTKNFPVEQNQFMDYYYQTILPATDIPQELKDAWVYQAKKSEIWK